MSTNSRINELVEAILDSSRTAEEVCADCPELLEQVRDRLRKVQAVAAEFDLLLPTSTREVGGGNSRGGRANHAELPQIDGYEMQAELGRGGMGIVYHARHVRLNRSVALKMLLAGSYASRVELLRFVREAEAVAGLRHPQIVQVYDVGEVDGRPFYTMEYIDGGSLADRIARSPLSIREAAELLVLLARAVESAHREGIVHRDLKPANILLTKEGTPKISDFGLARRVDVDQGLTMTGAKIGTPSYMAPEQVSGGRIGPAVDIFGLGALLYEMLTGSPPFRGETLSETERRLVHEEPKPPSQFNRKVPRDLETICLKCLEKSGDKRYSSAGELADDLERFLRYEPIRARPAGPTERAFRWVRRNPAAAALGFMAAALVGLLIYAWAEELALAADRRAEKLRLTARLESGLELERQGRYTEARALLGKLGDGGHPDLRQRIDHAVANLDLIEELNLIALDRVSIADGASNRLDNRPAIDERYAAIFASTGIGSEPESCAVVAERIGESEIRPALVAAIDDWAACASDVSRRDWLLEIARRADPDPTKWRDRVRNASKWNDRQELEELARTFSRDTSSVQLLRMLGDRLDATGADTTSFRKQVQQMHPDSFVANVALADALLERDPGDAIRYYQAAVAIEPQSVLAHNNFGAALMRVGQVEEAIDQLQIARQMDPELAVVHYNLGLAHAESGTLDEAIQCFRRAVEIEPSHVGASIALGEAYMAADAPAAAAATSARALTVLKHGDPQRKRVEDLLRRARNSLGAPSP